MIPTGREGEMKKFLWSWGIFCLIGYIILVPFSSIKFDTNNYYIQVGLLFLASYTMPDFKKEKEGK